MTELLRLLSGLSVTALMFLSTATGILGDYLGKVWSTNPKNPTYFILEIVVYTLSGIFFMPLLLKKGLVWSSVVWTILSASGFIFIGLLVFKEALTLTQIIGLFFGLIAIILLNI